jgi:hypothetical protein
VGWSTGRQALRSAYLDVYILVRPARAIAVVLVHHRFLQPDPIGGELRVVETEVCAMVGAGRAPETVLVARRCTDPSQPDALGRVSNCLVITSDKHHARLEYVAAKLPCMPCDVTFKFSIDTSGLVESSSSSSSSSLRYVALGFKETYAA